jgi:hypothetical protein
MEEEVNFKMILFLVLNSLKALSFIFRAFLFGSMIE